MNLSEDQYEVIEAYLTNELSTADRALFESDMQADAELRAEVDRQRAIRLGLRTIGIERALEKAKAQYKASSEVVPTESGRVLPLANWRFWAAAASVILVLGIGYYTYQQTADRQADIAYMEAFSGDYSTELIKDFPTEQVAPKTRVKFLNAVTTYKAGKYNDVIAQLKTVPADKQTVHYKNYFLGLTYLANKQPTEAIPLLDKAQASPSAKLRQKAEWFLALAYVKNGETKKALPMLKQISDDKTNPFYSLAQRVLQKID
ncbi:hypothetical protein GCM10028805_22160 [Spirosoma harenae]